MAFGGLFRGQFPERMEIARAESLDGGRQRFRIIFRRPAFLIVENDSVEPRTANPNDGRAARLTFERDQSERLLRSRVHKQIGSPIMARKLERIGAILNPFHAL